MADAKEITSKVLELGLDLAPLPPWVPKWAVKILAALVVATVIVLAESISWKRLFEEWIKNATPLPPNVAPPITASPDGSIEITEEPMKPEP